MINDLTIIPMDEMIDGFMGNMSDEQIDKEIKSMERFARLLKEKNFANIYVLIDYNREYDIEWLDKSLYEVLKKSGDWKLINVFADSDIKFIREDYNGNLYYYFKGEQDLNEYVEFYDSAILLEE